MKMEIDITCILVAICNCAIAKNTKLSTVLKTEKFRKSKMNYYVAREQIIMCNHTIFVDLTPKNLVKMQTVL